MLLTEENSDRALAVDSVSWVRDPLAVMAPNNYFAQDGHTRVLLLATNVHLQAGEDTSAITCIAEDANHRTFPLIVEYVGTIPNFDLFTQLVIRLSDEAARTDDIGVTITLHGQTSNRVMIKLKP